MMPRILTDRIFAGPALRAQPDRRLVALAREGSELAVEEIVRRYQRPLVRYAASIVPPDRADDVVQDSLARALPGIGSKEREIHLRPWLYTIVRNTALNDLRDAGPPHEHLDESYDGVEQPPQAMERRERVRSLVVGLQELPEAQREALVKREMEGMSHAEIGAELGVSVGAARQLIFRARNALREGAGALVPMPLLRQLAESGDGGGAAVAAAGAGGGGIVSVKAAIAVVATGAAVTTGVAIEHADRNSSSRAAAPVLSRTQGNAPPADIPTSPGTSSAEDDVVREVADRHGGRGPNDFRPPRSESHSGHSNPGPRSGSGHRHSPGDTEDDRGGDSIHEEDRSGPDSDSGSDSGPSSNSGSGDGNTFTASSGEGSSGDGSGSGSGDSSDSHDGDVFSLETDQQPQEEP